MVFSCVNLRQSYPQGDYFLDILKGCNLTIKAGECVALVGQSGSGKSTFLHIAGLLEKPSEGEVFINGISTQNIKDFDRTTLRRKYLGFVYQFHHLLAEFSSLENVMMPLLISGYSKNEAKEKALELLEKMGLSHRLHHSPKKMSGGEQQRVSIARALVHGPSLLLADEPTGNLDDATSTKVFDELLDLLSQKKLGAIIATHDMDLARRMDRIVHLQNGQFITE